MSNEKTKACGHPLDSYSHCWECTLVEARRSGEFSIRGATTLADAAPSAPQPASSPVAAEGQKAVEWQTPPASWRLIAKAAINLLFAIDEKHDTKQPPAKYSIPYGAVNDLRRALGAATPTASMADAAEAVARVEMLTGSLRHIAWLKEMPPVGTLLYATPGPRGENAGGVVEALSDEVTWQLWREANASSCVVMSPMVPFQNFADRVARACATAWGLRIAEKGGAS
jgi:hypothetical protein